MEDTFRLVMLEPLPTKNLKSLKTPYPYALLNDNDTYFLQSTCPLIEKQYICNYKDMLTFKQDTCYANILRGKEGSCVYTTYIDHQEIKQLPNRDLIIKNAPRVNISTTCGIQQRTLERTVLIHFRNCSISIEERNFENKEYLQQDQLFMLPWPSHRRNKTRRDYGYSRNIQD